MPRWIISAAAGLAMALVLCWMAVRQVLDDLSAPSQCQTTYIWQEYMAVNLSDSVAQMYPSYRVIAYVGDHGAREAGRRTSVPTLFVHGHLGTHQQMRSLASETTRELLRRAKHDASLGYWINWHGVDFGEEMSALSALLLARQAGFVVAAIKHLHLLHTSSSPEPFRLVVVGYSMGGIVARAALKQLEHDASGFDLSSVILLATLAAPNRHFPSFMPPTASQSRLALPPSQRRSSAAEWIPTLAVTAGPADTMVSEMLSGTPPEGANVPGSWVQLSMQDVPGVWTTSNHKSIVSCNQLVRHLAPLLADTVQLSQQPASRGPRPAAAADPAVPARPPAVVVPAAEPHGAETPLPDDTASAAQWDVRREILELARHRLSTNIIRSLSEEVALLGTRQGAGCSESAGTVRQPEGLDQQQDMQAGQAGAGEEELGWVYEEVPPGGSISLQWDASRQRALGRSGVVLLVSQAKPCRDFSLTLAPPAEAGRPSAGEGAGAVELAGAAQPLPPLVPGVLEHAGGPGHARPWREIHAGIDWLCNATWVLYVPFSALEAGSKLRLQLTARPGTSASVLAEVLEAHPLARISRLPPPWSPSLLPLGSPTIRYYGPPSWASLTTGSGSNTPCISTSKANGSCSGSILGGGLTAWAARVLFGTAPPLRLQLAQDSSCPEAVGPRQGAQAAATGQQQQCHLAAVVAVAAEQEGGSSGSQPDLVRVGWRAVSLWRGIAAGRSLVLITDPRCCHTLRLEWDVATWLGVSLRHHAYAVPSLCIALSMRTLGCRRSGLHALPAGAGSALPEAAAVVIAAWGSQHAHLAQRGTGLLPWASISVAECAALFAVAYGLLIFMQAATSLAVWLAAVLLPWAARRRGNAAVAVAFLLWSLAVVGTVVVHPTLALLTGMLRLWLSLAVAGSQCWDRHLNGSGSESGRSKRGWPEASSATASTAGLAHEEATMPAGLHNVQPEGGALRRRPGQPAAEALIPRPPLDAQPDSTRPAVHQQRCSHAFPSPARNQRAGRGACYPPLARQDCKMACLVLYTLMLCLAAPSLVAWAHSRLRGPHAAGLGGGLSRDRVCLAVMGLHACWVASQADEQRTSIKGTTARVLREGVMWAISGATAVTGLWGYPYVAVYTGCMMAALMVCEGAWQALQSYM